jgi:ABC-type transporter Mla maintaining outer membrane lipid asymmetry permease subunit MlaE
MTFQTPTNITRPYMMFEHVDVLTNGMFGIVILIAVFIIALISMKNHRGSAAFGAASFITLLIALILRALNSISDLILIAVIIITTLSVAFLLFEGKWK